jgi:hypothetical protein
MDCSYHMLHALIVEISSLFLGCGLYCSLGIMPRLSKLKPRILELKAEERALDAAEFKPRQATDLKEKTGTNRSQASTGEERTVED